MEICHSGDSIDDWKTLITAIDRADARTKEGLDRWRGFCRATNVTAQRFCWRRRIQDRSGAPYNYVVAAFEEPAKHRVRAEFVKMAMGVPTRRSCLRSAGRRLAGLAE